jgi:hypothetical protein
MKMTGLMREHFPTGQTFSQKALDDYLAAKARAKKDFLTRYSLSLLVGVAAGFILSRFLTDGIVSILLPMLCVMAGALIGTRLITDSMENLRKQSQKLCLTKKDLRAAFR